MNLGTFGLRLDTLFLSLWKPTPFGEERNAADLQPHGFKRYLWTPASAAEPQFSTPPPLMFSISCKTHAQVYLSCRPPTCLFLSSRKEQRFVILITRRSKDWAQMSGRLCSAHNPLLQPHKFIRVHLFDPSHEPYVRGFTKYMSLNLFTRNLGVWIGYHVNVSIFLLLQFPNHSNFIYL